MSDHQGAQDQDPAERLAAALRRLAVAVERRDASAASAVPVPPAVSVPPAVAGNLDALIARLRAVLDETSPDVRPGGDG